MPDVILSEFCANASCQVFRAQKIWMFRYPGHLSCVTLLENGVTKNFKQTFPARTFFTQLLLKICARSDLNHFRGRLYF